MVLWVILNCLPLFFLCTLVAVVTVVNRGCVANDSAGVNEVLRGKWGKFISAICGTDSLVGDICCNPSGMSSVISTVYELKLFASGLYFKRIKYYFFN